MTDETKQENPETTAPEQAGAEAAPPVADDGASSLSDGGLTLDDSEPEIPQPTEAPTEKPADDIPETSLSLEMDEPEPVAPASAEEAPVPVETAAEAPVTEAPAMEDNAAAPVFDDNGATQETAPPAEEPVMTSSIQEEPSFAENPAVETPVADAPAEPVAMTGTETPPPPPVAEAPQDDFGEDAGGAFDEFPGDDAAAFGGGDGGGDDGFGGDDFGDDDGFPSEDGMMPPPEKSGSKKKILMAGGALALAAIVGGGYFVLSSAGEVTPPPKRVAKVAPQDPGPAPKNDFAAANTGSDSSSGSDVIGMAAPPQPTPLTNTDNLDTGFGEKTELAAVAVEKTSAVPPTDSWTMSDEGSTDDMPGDLAAFGDASADEALTGDSSAGDALADGAEDTAMTAQTADTGTASDYDPSRETVTVTGLDDGALPPPPVDTEADAAPLDFTGTGDDAAAEASTETTAAEETAAESDIVADTAADDPLTALEAEDSLAGENGFTDSPPVAISDLEPPGMMGTQTSTSTVETPQIETATIKKAVDPLAEPAVKAAIAPKAHDPLTPAPAPGEPPPILSSTTQVKDMMPPTKPELTPAEQARIEQARMAMSQGQLEGDAIEEHKKTLREVPAKEAMIRPLPKSYLIMKRADGKAGQAIEAPQPQAGTSLANISSKPDLMGQAVAEQRAGNTAAALQTYEKILSDNPSDLNALTNMLGILRKQHSTLALEKLTELHSLYPRHPGVAAQLAVTYADKKSYREALHYFDIAASLDTPNAYYPFSKGVILDRMGRRGEANSYYQEALTMLEQGKTGRQQVPLNALRRRLGIPAY